MDENISDAESASRNMVELNLTLLENILLSNGDRLWILASDKPSIYLGLVMDRRKLGFTPSARRELFTTVGDDIVPTHLLYKGLFHIPSTEFVYCSDTAGVHFISYTKDESLQMGSPLWNEIDATILPVIEEHARRNPVPLLDPWDFEKFVLDHLSLDQRIS